MFPTHSALYYLSLSDSHFNCHVFTFVFRSMVYYSLPSLFIGCEISFIGLTMVSVFFAPFHSCSIHFLTVVKPLSLLLPIGCYIYPNASSLCIFLLTHCTYWFINPGHLSLFFVPETNSFSLLAWLLSYWHRLAQDIIVCIFWLACSLLPPGCWLRTRYGRTPSSSILD